MLHCLVWGENSPTLLIGGECRIRILSVLFPSGGLVFILTLQIAILSTAPVCELVRYEI